MTTHRCVYEEWYMFNKCEISTCKNYNPLTDTHCLAIDRVRPDGNKVISDEEIRLYKFNGEKISTRLVSLKRKRATDRVRNILALNEFIKYIGDNKPVDKTLVVTKSMRLLETRYPLKYAELGFASWMWKYLLDDACWKDFTSTTEITVQQLLNLNDRNFAILKKSNRRANHGTKHSNANGPTYQFGATPIAA